MMITLVVLALAVCTFAEQSPPYPASGWRPEGPAFELPNFQTNFQFSQRQEAPLRDYGTPPAVQSPSSVYGVGEIQKSQTAIPQNQPPLTYKEYVEQQNKLQNNQGFLQMPPNSYIRQRFNNVDIQASIQSTYEEPNTQINQQFQSRQNINDYLPPNLNSFPTPRENQEDLLKPIGLQSQYLPPQNVDVRASRKMPELIQTQEQYPNTEQRNFGVSPLDIPNQPNFKTELIPDFPAYNPNITHIEDTGNAKQTSFRNQYNAKQLRFNTDNVQGTTESGYSYDSEYRTIMLDDEDRAKIDDVFGRRVLARKTVVRKNRKPVSGKGVPNQRKDFPRDEHVPVTPSARQLQQNDNF